MTEKKYREHNGILYEWEDRGLLKKFVENPPQTYSIAYVFDWEGVTPSEWGASHTSLKFPDIRLEPISCTVIEVSSETGLWEYKDDYEGV